MDVPADLMRENLDPAPPQVPRCPDPRVTLAGEEDSKQSYARGVRLNTVAGPGGVTAAVGCNGWKFEQL